MTTTKSDLKNTDSESEVLSTIDRMPESDRAIGAKFHEIVRKNAPFLLPKLWYGMPAYATDKGKIVCFFQSAQKFHTRYATIGFMHEAKLDEGNMWPAAYAVLKLSSGDEQKLADLVKKSVS